jgi:hypothetical protein
MLLVSPGGRPGEHFSPVSALSEYLAHDLSLGPSLPELGQTGVLGVVGEDEHPVHRSRLRVVLLGSEQEVKPGRRALVAGQYGSAPPPSPPASSTASDTLDDRRQFSAGVAKLRYRP